ncbi:MAG: amidase [Vulcanimicrobiaceae bacterium]
MIFGTALVAAVSAPAPAAERFQLQEATIAQMRTALDSKAISCHVLVQSYLDRIAAYDKKGPALNAILTLNPAALQQADTYDRAALANAKPGPLGCVPIVLKDNYDTADLPTTAGAVALKGARPRKDATVVAKLRAAGAIVLAKTNLHEFALAGMTSSSLGGQTRNPYDLTRTPGGSSGGTGAAVAANLAAAGTGSDTVNSVRSPASANSLVGIRPTRGLVSRAGIVPVSFTQDAAGPIARSVTDAARLLDVMAGQDASDPVTRESAGHIPATYLASLQSGALKGARIGVLRNFFGTKPEHLEVNSVVDAAVERMKALGATIVPITIPDLDTDKANADYDVQKYEYASNLNAYLATLGPAAPIKSLAELVKGGAYDPTIGKFIKSADAIPDGLHEPDYQSRLVKAAALRATILAAMDDAKVDTLVYPEQKRLVVPIGESQIDRNGILAAMTGLPVVVIPAGFSTPTASAPLGVPVGVELLGRAWSEPRLLGLAFSMESATHIRKPPASAPPLAGAQ